MKHFNDIIEKLEPMMYSHEKDALIRWNAMLSSGVCEGEAHIYYEASQVILTTIKKRIEEEDKKIGHKLHVVKPKE